MAFRAIRLSRVMLVTVLLLGHSEATPSIGVNEGKKVASPERDTIRTDVARVDTLPNGSDPLVVTYGEELKASLAQDRFFAAAEQSDESLMRRSVLAGADLDGPKNAAGETALHHAADPKVVSWLADLGANLDIADARGRTPLMHAASERDERVVDALLVAGAQPGLRDQNESALTIAIRLSQNSHTRIVRSLLENGAPITPVEFLSAMGSRNPETLQLLFEFGGTFDPSSSDGQAILKKAQQSGGPQINALLRNHPVVGPVLRGSDKANQLERTRQITALAATITPYGMVFSLFLTSVPFLLALASWTWFRKPFAHCIATVALSAAAIYLAYFPHDVRESLAEFRFFGELTTSLPHLLSAAAVILILPVAAVIAPAVFVGFSRRKEASRHPAQAILTGALSLAFFVLLILHNLERVDVVDQAHRQMIEAIQSIRG